MPRYSEIWDPRLAETYYTVAALQRFLQERNIPFPRKAKRGELYQLLQQRRIIVPRTVPQIVQPLPQVQRAQRRISSARECMEFVQELKRDKLKEIDNYLRIFSRFHVEEEDFSKERNCITNTGFYDFINRIFKVGCGDLYVIYCQVGDRFRQDKKGEIKRCIEVGNPFVITFSIKFDRNCVDGHFNVIFVYPQDRQYLWIEPHGSNNRKVSKDVIQRILPGYSSIYDFYPQIQIEPQGSGGFCTFWGYLVIYLAFKLEIEKEDIVTMILPHIAGQFRAVQGLTDFIYRFFTTREEREEVGRAKKIVPPRATPQYDPSVQERRLIQELSARYRIPLLFEGIPPSEYIGY